jgi:signal transduction histidine kinase
MVDAEFQKAYAEQNRQDQITYSTLATVLSMLLNLFCSVMDYFMYGRQMGRQMWWRFFEARLLSVVLVGATWIWFRSPLGRRHYRVFGVMWYASPLAIILWMIWYANDPVSPYYAGLNIVLLAVGLLSPWTYVQNLISAVLVLIGYVVVCLAMPNPQPLSYLINNTTFLLLTAVIVVGGSVTNARGRYREFEMRWELDKNRRAIEESNRKLKELDQLKSRFFANISHELRTPLTLLLAPLETLLHRYKGSLDAETRDLLATMHSNSMRLLKLINDLLDLVRLESGVIQVKREPLAVAEFIQGLASAARQMAKDKRITLETVTDPALGTALVDRDKLEKIILNLQFNALKFTPAGGRVEICAEKQGGELVISVKDTGIGISATNLPNVFSRFWQADDSSRRKYQGVGIGLALVKEFTEIQGGKVLVESTEGKGTTFTVRLPYTEADLKPTVQVQGSTAEPAAETVETGNQEWLTNLYRRAELFPVMTSGLEPSSQVETNHNGHDAPSLLVADDEPDMLRFLKSQLNPHFRVIEAVDGQQAIEKAREFLPDTILLDMMMPQKDGLQACREIRQGAETKNIPIILLTARADEETKLAALEAGASDFLPKPFSSTELHVRVTNLVESYQYQRKLAKQNAVLENTIEQLKDTETQLVQTEKLASLGRMSAGIIHEINNPLNFATTGLFTLRNKGKFLLPEQQEEYQEILQDVEDGIKRVKSIVSELRTFSHPDMEGRDQVEVSEVVSSALKFLSNEWKDKVQVEQSLTEHQTIWANKSKLVQVVVNLLQNSMDAMKTKAFENEKPTVRIEGFVENKKSVLRVRDNGAGIDPKILDKIFDPFFTTKDVGEGMGLGLSICYRIVEECDGRISVKTEPGKFCEFTLEFPAKG